MSSSRDVDFFHTRFSAVGSAEDAATRRAYHKSTLQFHGVSVPDIRRVSIEYCKEHPSIDRRALHELAMSLFATDWYDLHSAAIEVLEKNKRKLEAADLSWLTDLVRRSANWAHVDNLSTKVMAHVVERQTPTDRARQIRQWAKDDDFWVRRTALLVQLGTLRKGKGDFVLFTEVAVPMLSEKEFFIRKAIGWVLREVSKKRPDWVIEFLRAHGEQASKLTVREASKYLPRKSS